MTRPVQGLRAWGLQRISSLYLLGFILFVGGFFLVDPPLGYQQWRQWVARPGVSVGTALFFIMLLVHAWVGIRDVIMDYAHNLVLRVVLLGVVAFGLIACGAWAARVLVGASTG